MIRQILIVYYSHSSNTRKLAKLIEQETSGMLVELVPEEAYPSNHNAVVEQAKKEIQTGFRPKLNTEVRDIATYDTVFVGTPNWWHTIAPPVATFLDSYDLSGKDIVPFCTHGGGGSAQIEAAINKLCPEAVLLPPLAVYGDTAKASEVEYWLRRIGIK